MLLNARRPNECFEGIRRIAANIAKLTEQLVTPSISGQRTKTGRYQRGVAQALGVALAFCGQGDNSLADDFADDSRVTAVMKFRRRSIVGGTKDPNHVGIEAAIGRDKSRDLSHPRCRFLFNPRSVQI